MVIKTAVLPKDERGNDPNDFVDDPDFLEKIEPAPNALSKLVALSTTNRIDEIEMNLKNDEYVFIDLALMGQMTLFYAAPNTGKTLLFIFMLIESIKAGRIKAEDIFYINADDNYKGIFNLMESLIDGPDLLIYLRSSIPNLVNKIHKRGRDYENSISIDYLSRLNERYEAWVSTYDAKKIIIIAYLKNLIRLLSVTNPSLAKKNVITGSSNANPKPKRSFVKKLTYSPMLGSALKS